MRARHAILKEGENVGGQNPLLEAARSGAVPQVRDLLDTGVPIGVTDRDRRTALHLAAAGGHMEAARLLLDRGADINAKDRMGGTPLHHAVTGGYTQALGHLAADAERSGCLGGLIGALLWRVSQRRAPADGEWAPDPRVAAAAGALGESAMVRLLLERGAAPDLCDNLGSTPVSWAAMVGNAEVAAILLDHMPKACLPGGIGEIVLHQAAEFGHAEVARTLLERGVDVNARRSLGEDDWACTPLQRATQRGHAEVAALLRGFGASE